jgi:HEAT repeat protein
MRSPFGPWATAVERGGSVRLSAFWKKRLAMLAGLSRCDRLPSRRMVLWLLSAGLVIWAAPTFRGAHLPQAAAEPPPAAGEPANRPAVAPPAKAAAAAESSAPAEPSRVPGERINQLIEQLSSKDGQIRGRAAYELGKIGPTAAPAVPALIGLLGDLLAPIIVPEEETHGTQISTVATNALVNIGKPAVEPLLRALQQKDPKRDVRDYVARTLGKIGDPRAIPPLLEALDHEKQPVRNAASTALGDMGRAAFRPLADRLRDPSARVRLGATWGIVWVNCAAINRTGTTTFREESAKLLIGQLDDESGEVRRAALSGLRSLGRTATAIDRLLAMVDDPNDDVRAEVFSALAESRDPRAVEIFLAGFDDPSKVVRWRSAEGLGWLRAKAGVEPLLAALKSEDATLRRVAARSLGQIGDRRALKPLIALAQTDQEADMRAAVGWAIGQIEYPHVPRSGIAWGEPVHGLRLGLCCVSGIRPYRLGEIVRYERVIRNTGDRDWTFELLEGGFITPDVENGQVVLHSGRIVNGVIEVARVRVPAGRDVRLDTTEFTLRPVGWQPIDRPQSLRLAPGKYRVSTIYLPEVDVSTLPEGSWTEKLTTGELELAVLGDMP